MTKEAKFLEIVAEILEEDSVEFSTELDEDKWDSLAVVTFISEIDSEFDIVVSPNKVGKVENVQQLFDLI